MKMIKFILLLVIVLLATPAPAEIYKYVDEQGKVHFTDDINQVPVDQRDSYEVSSEYVSDPDTEPIDTGTESADFNADDSEQTDPDLESSYGDETETTPGFDVDGDDQNDMARVEDDDALNPTDSGQNELEADRNRLEALKKEIDQEYADLVKEKEKLTQEQKTLKTREDILKYNAKVESLNKRADAYVQKGKQYQQQVEEYNERVIQRNAQINKEKQ